MINLSRRYYVGILAFLGFCNVYSMRVNLSVAILQMTKNGTKVTEDGRSVVVPAEFRWDSVTVGAILSAFFYGYIITQLPGGWLAAKYGGKRVLGYGILATAASTIFTPFVAPWGAGWLMALRVVEGLFEGVCYPAMHAIWANWAPTSEKTRLVTLAFSGSYFGTVISLPLTGALAGSFGWRSVFYFFGSIAIAWSLLWLLTITDSPQQDKHISPAELELIERSVVHSEESHKPPWISILKSMPVWAIVVAHTAENYGFYTMLTELPRYLTDISSSFHLEKASLLAAIPYLVMGIAVQFAGHLADYLQRAKGVQTIAVRKIFNCAAFFAQALFIIANAYAPNVATSIIFVTIAVGCGGFAWSGFSVNPLDLAPQYASILMGISNTFATLPGMLGPVIAGALVPDGTMAEWQKVWWIVAAIYLCGGIFYGIFAAARLQSWASSNEVYRVQRNFGSMSADESSSQ